MIKIAYWIAIGAACIISSIYFYYTQRNTICYYDDEIPNIKDTLHV